MQCPHGFFGILDELFLRRLIYAGQLMQLNKDYFFFHQEYLMNYHYIGQYRIVGAIKQA